MSLRELNARTRRRLRWHGWLLTLWCLAIGLLGSWLLLRVFGVRVPAVRYAMSASFDEAAWLLILSALIMLALGALTLAGGLPVLLADGVAGMLAEIALQFVFGALIARRVLRPQAPDDAFMHIVGKTWIAGLGLVVASAAAGWLLTQLAAGSLGR